MNNFLREACKFRNVAERICIILGNESCDLDSAVSSLSLAYFLHKNPDEPPLNNKTSKLLPILNVPRKEFQMKTEVTYFLKSNLIDADLITFKDDIDETFFRRNYLILVDHHASPYSSSVIGVYDHRPYDEKSNLPEDCAKTIKRVGSCSTLIAHLILDSQNPKYYLECLRLLYGAIVLDTVCFSKAADKATEFDIAAAMKIENLLDLEISAVDEYRKSLFDDLVRARNDLSTLDSFQILFKDMKMLQSENNERIKVALPGYPILVQDFIKLENAEENVKKFAKIQGACVVLLIGMQINVEDNSIKRDLGLINIGNDELYSKILNSLINQNDPNLELEEYENCGFMKGKFFKQNNIKATRKQIVPIIKSVLDSF